MVSVRGWLVWVFEGVLRLFFILTFYWVIIIMVVGVFGGWQDYGGICLIKVIKMYE
jgi:hypothetical protein